MKTLRIVLVALVALIGLLVLLPTGSRPAQATDWCAGGVCQEWAARYDSLTSAENRAYGVAVDGSGNVYVTGTAEGPDGDDDYATVKYDSDGNELWVARYDGPANGDDRAYAIAVDSDGNAYVTGGSGTFEDYATVKYDPNGNQLWVAEYEGPAGAWDVAEAIALDPDGNVWVTGRSHGSGTGWYDYATVKYDASDGSELCVARYDGPASERDEAYAIAVDGSSNVYVTGASQAAGTDDDYATVKYDSNCNELWAARYDGPANGLDKAQAIAVDSNGNVYVTGQSEGPDGDDDYATVKYGPTGSMQWERTYSGPCNFGFPDDRAYAIAVDGDGNAYVTGESCGSGTFEDYATVKYDPNGNQLWVAEYEGPGTAWDVAEAIALDPDGNVWVTGRSHGSGTGWYDYATVKYDASDGSELCAARYDGPANGRDEAHAIAVGSGGNVYVTGASESSDGDYDYATVKYDPNCNQLWVARYDALDSDGDGVPDADEYLYGSDPTNPDSTPEDSTYDPETCKDGVDNDLDGLIDSDDPGCPLVLCGDVDCNDDVDAVDALFILQYVVGLRLPSDQCPPPEGHLYLSAGDVDCDDDVDAVDALFVLQHVVGLRPELCVCPGP